MLRKVHSVTLHSTDVIAKVNAQIQSSSHGRLFAVIQMAGKQRRVTDGDLIMIEGFYPTNVGDMIRAEKILLVGSRDFTLLGRPLLRPDLVRVEATVIEKSLTHTKTSFKKKRRKNYKRIHCNLSHYLHVEIIVGYKKIFLQFSGTTLQSCESTVSVWKD